MLTLRGNSPATIDEKGRLKLPSIFRFALEKSQSKNKITKIDSMDFYLTSLDLGVSLVLFPLPIWEQHEKVLVNLPFMHPGKRKMLHSLSFHGSEVSPDNQGRIVIPQKLREQAKLAGEISILGMIDHLALWNTASYQDLSSKDPVTSEDLMTLSRLGG